MKPELIGLLACPACRGRDLKLDVREETPAGVASGRLTCAACGQVYRIENGLPFLLPGQPAVPAGAWEKLHQQTDYGRLIGQTRRRLESRRDLLEDYFSHVRLVLARHVSLERVVDLGSGSGSYALALAFLAGVRELVLLDISPTALAAAGRLLAAFGYDAHLVVGDIRRLPLRDRAFTLALSGGLIEHFARGEQEQIVGEHCRVADQVLIQAPEATAAYWTFRALYTLYRGGWPFGYEKPLTKKKLARLLAGHGFQASAWDRHDFASALVFLGSQYWKKIPRFHRWPGMARLTRHDVLVLARRLEE